MNASRFAQRIERLESRQPPPPGLPIVSIILQPGEDAGDVLLRDHPDRPDLLAVVEEDERNPGARKGPIRLIVRQIVDPPARPTT